MTRAVDINGRGVRVEGRGVGIGSAIPDSVTSRPDDDSTLSRSTTHGIEITLKSDYPEQIGARYSSLTSGATKAYLEDKSSGTILDTVDISSLSSGDTFFFNNVSLNDGDTLFMYVDAEGSSFTVGFNNIDNFPYTGPDLDITKGFVDGGAGGATRCLNDIGNPL